jgi:hypothetical protein
MKRFALLIGLCLLMHVPGKMASSTPAVDFSELDKLIPTELKEKNTPGAVITVISGDSIVYQ